LISVFSMPWMKVSALGFTSSNPTLIFTGNFLNS